MKPFLIPASVAPSSAIFNTKVFVTLALSDLCVYGGVFEG